MHPAQVAQDCSFRDAAKWWRGVALLRCTIPCQAHHLKRVSGVVCRFLVVADCGDPGIDIALELSCLCFNICFRRFPSRDAEGLSPQGIQDFERNQSDDDPL